MDKGYDQEKVKANLTFDSAEWSKTRKLLDDPNISDAKKKRHGININKTCSKK